MSNDFVNAFRISIKMQKLLPLCKEKRKCYAGSSQFWLCAHTEDLFRWTTWFLLVALAQLIASGAHGNGPPALHLVEGAWRVDPERRFKLHNMEGIPAGDPAAKCNLATTDVVIVVSIGEYNTTKWRCLGSCVAGPVGTQVTIYNNPRNGHLNPNKSFFLNMRLSFL